MNLEEYKSFLLEELKVSSEYEMNDINTEFVKYVTDILIDAEEFDDFVEGYWCGTGERNKKLVMDGYYFDQFDKSCVLLISDFTTDLTQSTLTSTDINRLYDNMRNLLEACIDGYILTKGFEESSIGYGLAKEIKERLNEIVKFRFYIITNKQLSDRVKNIKKEAISNKPVELNVWDITRLYAIYSSTLGKESIEIDLSNISDKGLSCVKATNSDEYEAYLAVIPGNVLANMYIEYGSRLLEGNVRSFLSIKGKVNKGIRNTILNEPNMFFAYNNGIAATATEIETKFVDNQLYITKMKDLQIINGGQTTASIANAILQDKANLSEIFVPMKLSVVNHDKAKEMIPTISRCANSQNKVDEADFFSNHQYHIRIEEYSRKISAPAVNGNQYQTIWFYERARGQYVQEQMKLTPGERKKFQLKNPKNQLVKKVDLAKYISTYEAMPHIVSKGAQANMRSFAEKIDKEWEKDNTIFNEYYYKKIISLAILFKNTEALVTNQQWYREIKAYRANIVTYAISIIFYKIRELYPNKTIDYKKIWNSQKIYPLLENQLLITTKEMFNFITRDDRATLNVTEWCKKEACWDRAKKERFTLNPEFIESLIEDNEEKELEKDAKSERKVENQLNLEIEVINLGEEYWRSVLEFGKSRRLLTPMEEDLLFIASNYSNGKIPSAKQAKIIFDIREKLFDEGLPKNNTKIELMAGIKN